MAEQKRDYYEVLGVDRGADEATIKKAYRQLEDEGLIRSHAGAKSFVSAGAARTEALRQELPEWSAWINQEELERFGQLHFSPYFSYSLPADAETVWGCLSYTLDLSAWQSLARDDPFYDSTHVFLRRQTQLLHYPFADINQLGGARQTGQWGPIQTAYGTCWYNGPGPQ